MGDKRRRPPLRGGDGVKPGWRGASLFAHVPTNVPTGRPPAVNMVGVPTVLYPLTLPALLDYVLATQAVAAATLLVVCSSRDAFLQDLSESLQQHHSGTGAADVEQLIQPTLHNLSTTRHVRLAFCASVQALLAYLAAYRPPDFRPVGDTEGKERLVLVNPLALHVPTSSFSAQGLSRTFAAAVEAAIRTGTVLHVVECQGQRGVLDEHDEEDSAMEDEHEESHAQAEEKDPWLQDVAVLNVSARRSASGSGGRAWAGRTVTARRIAARWLHFHELGDGPAREDPG